MLLSCFGLLSTRLKRRCFAPLRCGDSRDDKRKCWVYSLVAHAIRRSVLRLGAAQKQSRSMLARCFRRPDPGRDPCYSCGFSSLIKTACDLLLKFRTSAKLRDDASGDAGGRDEEESIQRRAD